MAISEVSICNQALSWLGQETITSLDDQATTAVWMNANYDLLRDSVMEARMWTFATVRAVSTSVQESEWGDGYVHAKPLGWLSVSRVYRDNSRIDPVPVEWRLESEGIITRESTIYLLGLKQVVDPRKFSNLFVQALAARLAADACIPFTENATLQRDMWTLYNDKLEEAAARDGQQGSNDFITQRRLVGARYSGGYTGGRY
tara:strand:- start:9874 stop:10479 length:606 start_codon:yes stop_codon:yes gene_type:complete